MPTYKATVVETADLGELEPKRGKELRFGTPIHSVLFQAGKGALEVERIEIKPGEVRVVYRKGRGPRSGRVSLAPEIEVFDRDDHRPKKLAAVRITFAPTESQQKRIQSMLRAAAPDKVLRVKS